MIEDPFRLIRTTVERQNQIDKIADGYNRIQRMLEPRIKFIDSTCRFDLMTDTISRMRLIESGISIINPAIRKHTDRLIRIRESIDQFNNNLPGYLVSIANFGWYLDLHTGVNLSVTLANYIEDKEIEKVDNYLIDYYSSNFDIIITKLSSNHPKRLKLFSEIKIAFDNEYYNLVIPLLLSQIDGICYDYTKKLFFIKNKKNEKNPYLPKVSNELIVLNGEFFKAFLAPFFNDAPIFTHEDNLELFPTAFNRHRVLHGLEIEFGTKINCLKALSLLSYCDDVLFRIANDVRV
jgi:hypothetical protein